MADANHRLKQRLNQNCGSCKNFKEGSSGGCSIGACLLTLNREHADTGLPDGSGLPVNRNPTYGYGACAILTHHVYVGITALSRWFNHHSE